MPVICPCRLPDHALLYRYAKEGAYTDCYTARIPKSVSQGDFVTAFYTTWLFNIERLILRWAVSRPSTDAEARQLAIGERRSFAAWTVEDRSESQLLLCDLYGRTRSWLMTVPQEGGTQLYFGSAVLPVRNSTATQPTMGFQFKVLLGFHRLYSRGLLRAATKRLMSMASAHPCDN